MKNRIGKMLILAILSLPLTGCGLIPGLGGDDSGDDEEADFNLYTLQLQCNMTDSAFLGQTAELNPAAVLSEEEIDEIVAEYGSKGATKENFQKVGTYEDGKYYFMSQDPIYLHSPQVIGYEFEGWFDGDKRIDGGIDLDYDGKSEMVNMAAKNTVLVAKYKPVDFSFRIASQYDNDIHPAEMMTWNVTMDDYVLPTDEVEGMNFKKWDFSGYYFNHAEGIVNVGQGETPDPRSYKTIENVTKIDKNLIEQLGDVAYGYCAELETDLVAHYETQKVTVTISWDSEIDNSLFVTLNNRDLFADYEDDTHHYHWIQTAIDDGVEGASNPLSFTCDYGTSITVYYTIADDTNYTFDGFKDADGKVLRDSVGSYTFVVKGNSTINIAAHHN